MQDYRNATTLPQDLTGGRVVAPGERVSLSASDERDAHNARLISEGQLIKVPAKQVKKESTSTKQGGEE